MKKTIAFILTVCVIFICMTGCSIKKVMPDLSQTNVIRIRVISSTREYTDYVVSDKEIIQSICDTFSSLELEKINISEDLHSTYSLGFYETNTTRKAIESFILLDGWNVIDDGEDLYQITNDVNVREYMADIVANLPDEWIDRSEFFE